MAVCDIGALLADATTNGFVEVSKNPLVADAVALQLLKNWSGGTETTDELLVQACSNQFACVQRNPKMSNAVALQIACNINA